jgi:parallel beta-helix repeat protein
MFRRAITIVVAVFAAGLVGMRPCVAEDGNVGAASLDPPDDAFSNGRPVASMKTLNQVEPRTAIYELPYVIKSSGSYYLADSLDGSPGRSGITIAAHDVGLDLNGFSIWGTNGSFHGIFISNGVHNVAIRNGVIGEWSGWGLFAPAAHNTDVSDVRFYENGLGGMRVGFDSTLERCAAMDCGGPGIVAGDASTLTGCKASDNAGDGIRAGGGAQIVGCMAEENGGHGIFVTHYATVSRCLSVTNATNGISAEWSCLLRNNNCGENGRTSGVGAGIHLRGNANRVEGNNLTDNHIGILLTAGGNRVSENSIIENFIGLQDAADGNLIHGNNAGWSQSGTNFMLSGRSSVGRILRNPESNFINQNPWANFEIE